MTQTGVASYNYNAENQMAQASTGAATGYVYDGDGNRIEKLNSSGAATKLYWYSGGNVLDETDGTGSMSNSGFNEYVFFGGKRIARRNSGGVYYYVEDHLGTSREIVQAGQTSACYDADFYPFGGEMTVTDTCDSAYKFTGKERDSLAENGNLDNFGARFDASTMGRFMSPDPSMESATRSLPQSWNRYSYTINNPLRFIDPDGEMWTANDDPDHPYKWVDTCGQGQSCVDQIATQVGESVNVYGPNDAQDIQTLKPNENGYIDLDELSGASGAQFQFKSGAEYWGSPETAVDLYNAAGEYHDAYPKDAKLFITDAGDFEGTNFGKHKTHNMGRSVDLRYMDENGQPLARGSQSVYLADDQRMKSMVDIFKENGFNQNYSDNANGYGVGWADGHEDHIHFGKTWSLGRCEIGPCR